MPCPSMSCNCRISARIGERGGRREELFGRWEGGCRDDRFLPVARMAPAPVSCSSKT